MTVSGQTDLNGHVNLGNGTGDNISIVGRIDNLDPDANNTYDVGTTGRMEKILLRNSYCTNILW